MLRNEVARYTELSGNDGLHTPIGIIGAYLDGYEKGRADAQPKLDENTLSEQQESDKLGVKTGKTCTDCISRQAAIDAPEKFIKDCNPEHFVGHQKFIEFMDDAEIGSFGNWQFANGFNLGLTAAEVATKNLPSAQRTGRWIDDELMCKARCSVCGEEFSWMDNDMDRFWFCPNCGSYNGVEHE